MAEKVIGPLPEDIARIEDPSYVPGMLRYSSSEHYGSPRARKVAGVASAGALLANGPVSAAYAPSDLHPAGVMENTVGFTHNVQPDDTDGVHFEPGESPQSASVRINTNYQRGFETNDEDVERATHQLDAFIDRNAALLANPDLVEEVDITGLVSAQDNRENIGEEGIRELVTPGPDLDGNGISEQDQLAQARYELTKAGLVERVRDRFGVDISDKIKPYDPEIDLHEGKFTKAELARAIELRDKFHFNSVEEMIDTFEGNFGEEKQQRVPFAVQRFLNRTIAKEQGALVEVIPKKLPGQRSKGLGKTAIMAHLAPGYIPEEQPGMPAPNRAFRRQAKDKPRSSQIDPRAPAYRRIQPREHSNSKSPSDKFGGRGKTGRSHGGNKGHGPGSKTMSRAAYKRVQMRRR